jgi:hypothetical protein
VSSHLVLCLVSDCSKNTRFRRGARRCVHLKDLPDAALRDGTGRCCRKKFPSRLHMNQNWPLWIAGFSLLISLVCVFTSLPPGVPYGSDGQRLVIYPLLMASNTAGLALLGLSLLILVLLGWVARRTNSSHHFREHLYHLVVMETTTSGFIDREAIVFQCDVSGILCHKIYASLPSGGCAVTNQALFGDTYLVAESSRKLYLQMDDQQIILVE